MRSALIAIAAALIALGAGWYVVEWLPGDAAVASPLPAAARAIRPDEIRSVRLAGERLPVTILESHLATRVGELLDDDVLDADRAALREVLVARGHWAAAVAAPELRFGPDGGAHVTFRITPGAVFKVRSVAIAGEDRAVLAPALTLAPGDEVSPDRLARNADLLAAHLARLGRAAEVSVETTTDRAANAVDVTFVVRRVLRSARR